MGHFYLKGGKPFYKIEKITEPGVYRDTNLSDVKKLYWVKNQLCVPGVTTITGIFDKGGLNNWIVEQHLKQAFNCDVSVLSYALGSTVEFSDYKKEIRKLAQKEMSLARDAGTNFHKLMENYINDTTEDFELPEKVYETIKSETGSKDFIAEEKFATELYGGSVDLHSDDWIIDYKTKNKNNFKAGKMVYEENIMQLSAYREGLGLKNAKCANVFICLDTQKIDFHVHSEKELEKGKHLFSHALQAWYIRNRSDHYQKQ